MMPLFLTVLLGTWAPDTCTALLPLDAGRSWTYAGPALRLATFADDPATQRAYDQWSDSLASRTELWLALPFRAGQHLGQVSPREDAMDGVVVGRPEAPVAIPDSCPRTAGPRYKLTYRSLPDHRIAEWQPGLGVTRFGYGHHGTSASADVELVACSGQQEG